MGQLELIEPGQQGIAAEVRGRRQLQQPAYPGLAAGQLLASVFQVLQGQSGMTEEQLAFRGQAQAARGAGEQPRLQLHLQALERGAGHRRRNIQPPCGGGQAAYLGGADKQLQVIEAEHGAAPFSKKY
ncbi:hypothetical protein FQZ97_1008680 [compost metagenome]